MLRCMPAHHMAQVSARLERAHHPRRDVVEHLSGDMIKQMTLELKVDDEVYVSLVPDGRECPCAPRWCADGLRGGADCTLSGCVRRWHAKKVSRLRRDRRVDGTLSVGLDDPCHTNSARAAATRYRRPNIAWRTGRNTTPR